MPHRLALWFTAQAYELLTATCVSTSLFPESYFRFSLLWTPVLSLSTSDLIKWQNFIFLKILQLYVLTIFHLSPSMNSLLFTHSPTHSLLFHFQSYPLFLHVQMTKLKHSRSLKDASPEDILLYISAWKLSNFHSSYTRKPSTIPLFLKCHSSAANRIRTAAGRTFLSKALTHTCLRRQRITESFWLEKPFKVIKSNC